MDDRQKRPNSGGDVSGFLMMLLLAALFGGLLIWIARAVTGSS